MAWIPGWLPPWLVWPRWILEWFTKESTQDGASMLVTYCFINAINTQLFYVASKWIPPQNPLSLAKTRAWPPRIQTPPGRNHGRGAGPSIRPENNYPPSVLLARFLLSRPIGDQRMKIPKYERGGASAHKAERQFDVPVPQPQQSAVAPRHLPIHLHTALRGSTHYHTPRCLLRS